MVALKICITKLLFHVISKVFKMIFNHVESLHRKSLFYTCFRKFWVIENSFPIVTKLGEISTKKKSQKYFNFRLYHMISDNSWNFIWSYKFFLQNKNSKPHWFFIYISVLDNWSLWKKIHHKTNFDWRHLISQYKILPSES